MHLDKNLIWKNISSDKVFVGLNYSSDIIFVTSKKYCHFFCPTFFLSDKVIQALTSIEYFVNYFSLICMNKYTSIFNIIEIERGPYN